MRKSRNNKTGFWKTYLLVFLIGFSGFNSIAQEITLTNPRDTEKYIIENFSEKYLNSYSKDIHYLIDNNKINDNRLYIILAYYYNELSSPYEFNYFLLEAYNRDMESLVDGFKLFNKKSLTKIETSLNLITYETQYDKRIHSILAILYYSQNELSKSHNELLISLDNEKYNPYLYYLYGKIKLNRKEYISAIASYNSAEKNGYYRSIMFKERGIAKGFTDDFKGAVEDFDKIIYLNNNDAETYFLRAIAKNYLNNYNSSISDLDQAILLDKNYASAYNYRGIIYSKLEDYANAIFDFKKTLSIDKNHPFTHNNLGLAHLGANQWEYAQLMFTKAIELNPNHSDAYYNRARTYYLQKDYKKSIKDLETSLNINYENPDAHYIYALCLIRSNSGKKLNRLATEICSRLEISNNMSHAKAKILLDRICIKYKYEEYNKDNDERDIEKDMKDMEDIDNIIDKTSIPSSIINK